MLNLNLPNDAVDHHLTELIYMRMNEIMKKLEWDLRSLMAAPLVVTLRNGTLTPGLEMQTHVKLTNGKVLGCTAHIDAVYLVGQRGWGDVTKEKDQALQAITMEADSMASSLVDGILKEYGTSSKEELGRIHERWTKKVAEDQRYLPRLVADPSVPPDTILAVNERTGEVLGRIQAGTIKETIRDALEERKKTAKWKID